jgi:ABC-type multidrug transport system ATPase subunit
MTPILEINHLYKKFGRLTAVNDLCMTIEAGTVFGLLGPNGSGKTTTLGMVLDVVQKTKGEYLWFGMPPSNHARKKIGAILEAPAFYPYLSAGDNLKIVAQIKNIPYHRIDAVLDKVGLLDRRNDRFQTYSLGMKQRLAIGSALLSDPQVLVLDEPTNGLDPQGIADVRELILKISAEGKTIILASHLLDEVQKVCSHFAVLRKGQMLYSGSVADALANKESVEVAAPDLEHLVTVIRQCADVKDMNINHQKVLVHLHPGKSAFDLNAFLINKGVVVSHLTTEKKNLEQQFLEILSQ